MPVYMRELHGSGLMRWPTLELFQWLRRTLRRKSTCLLTEKFRIELLFFPSNRRPLRTEENTPFSSLRPPILNRA